MALATFFTAGVFTAAAVLYEEVGISGHEYLTIPLESLLGFFIVGMILAWYLLAHRGVVLDSPLRASRNSSTLK
jgi:hypothetical protein